MRKPYTAAFVHVNLSTSKFLCKLVQFSIKYSDNDSLRYLFSEKATFQTIIVQNL